MRIIDNIKYYSSTEAAQLLGVHRNTIRNRIKSGKLGGYVIDPRTKRKLFPENKINKLKELV